MADETLLAGARVVPAKLMAAGFSFEHPELVSALEKILVSSGEATAD
jgi:NAD dependent epimerase/dehydratase family enzyme